MPALADRTAESLVMEYLAGLPDDPKLPQAYMRLQEVLLKMAVSVDHARAALQSLNRKFPSPRELEDSLISLFDRYQPPLSKEQQIAKWEAEGATRDPEWTEKMLGVLKSGNTSPADETFIERHKREWMTVVETWRTEDVTGRRRKLYPPDLAVAELRQRFGFTLTPWDKEALEAAGRRNGGAA